MEQLRSSTQARLFLLVLLVAIAIAIGVFLWLDREPEPAFAIEGGDIEEGRQALINYGCVACHTIPGVRGADNHVGPPLTAWSRRVYIAGLMPNEPDALIAWIRDPQSIEPGTAMPNLGVTEVDARHMATYLYTLD
jgi:cytochrome c